ncbi:MAG TPA: glycosyltransferase [Planctomycetota bacterium]|nr:glycosyltransferase [Planctomycetota bacterium]
MSSTRRVLLVAYHYPPAGGIAAQRPAKFARYLPDFGWEPLVVARRPDPGQPRDDSFLDAPEPRARIGPCEPSRILGLLPPGLREPCRRALFVPGPEIGWTAALAAALPRWMSRWRPAVVYASSVPLGSLVAAAWAARRARVPFVPDFHNEWTRNPYHRPATPLHAAAHRAMEDAVLRSSAAVVTLNPLHTEDLRARHPALPTQTVENGFDPADVPRTPRPPGRRPIVFTYAGAVYGHQDPAPFLRALAAADLRDVEVRIVGDRFSQFRAGAWPFPVSVRGHLPHRELARVYSESDAFFLCLASPAARQLPAKLYEYLGAGRPTFALVPPGGAADRFLRERGSGTSVDVDDPSAWGPALRRFVGTLDDYRPPSAPDLERSALAKKLAAVLDSAAGRRP